MRTMTERVALMMALAGSGDSAAAIVAISAPTMEKTTITMPEKIALHPLGKSDPPAVRLEKSMEWPGQRPRT